MDRLSGKVAVVTGAANGIGLATARAFAKTGMRLVLADTDAAGLDRVTAELAAGGTEVVGQVTDVGDRASVQGLADAAWSRFGAVHVLFNNAGVAVFGAVDTLGHSDWEWSLRVNLWGPIHGVEAFLPRLLASGEPAHIVNTASFAGLVPSLHMAAYNVAKSGVVALTESLRKDLRGTQVSASVLCPMRVATEVWRTSGRNRPEALGGEAAFRSRSEEETAAMSGDILDADAVAAKVVTAILENRLYIHTHETARSLLRRRFERLDAAF